MCRGAKEKRALERVLRGDGEQKAPLKSRPRKGTQALVVLQVNFDPDGILRLRARLPSPSGSSLTMKVTEAASWRRHFTCGHRTDPERASNEAHGRRRVCPVAVMDERRGLSLFRTLLRALSVGRRNSSAACQKEGPGQGGSAFPDRSIGKKKRSPPRSFPAVPKKGNQRCLRDKRQTLEAVSARASLAKVKRAKGGCGAIL